MQNPNEENMNDNHVHVAVIPVAGKGTRWQPITRSVAKELLPVWRRTSASYAFEEAVTAGIDEVIFVLSPDKHAVLEHFLHFDASDLSPNYRNESPNRLHERVKVQSCIQHDPKGLGHAILCAEQAVAERPFCVLLPDEVLMSNGISMLLNKTPAVLLMDVPYEDRNRYGIVGGEKVDDEFWIRELIEKPAPENAPSSLAITGRYTFTPDIFDYLRTQQPGVNGEIQLTDAMMRYTQDYPIRGIIYHGTRHDVGQPIGLLTASLDFALSDPQWRDAVRKEVEEILRKNG